MQNKKLWNAQRRATTTDLFRSKTSLKLTNQDVNLPAKPIADGRLHKLLNIANSSVSKKSFDLNSLTPLQGRSKAGRRRSSSFLASSDFLKRPMTTSSFSSPIKSITSSLKPRAPVSKFFLSSNVSKNESQPASVNVSQIETPGNQFTFSFTIRNQAQSVNPSPDMSLLGDYSHNKHSKVVTFSENPKTPHYSQPKNHETLSQNHTILNNLSKASLTVNSTSQAENSLRQKQSKPHYIQENFYNLRRKRHFLKESKSREKVWENDRERLLKYFKDPVKIAQVAFKQLDVAEYHREVAIHPLDIEITEEKEALRKLYRQFKPHDQKGPMTLAAISKLELTKSFSQLKFFNRIDSTNFVNSLKSLQIHDYTSSQSMKEYFKSQAVRSKLWMTDPQKLKRMQKNFFKGKHSNTEDRHAFVKKNATLRNENHLVRTYSRRCISSWLDVFSLNKKLLDYGRWDIWDKTLPQGRLIHFYSSD